MEYWDVYDAQRRPTGRTVRRELDPLREGEYHISVHVVIRDGAGRLLLQRRALEKEDWPGVWDLAAAAGSALAGECSRDAAARELREELGVTAELPAAPRITLTLQNCFADWYVLRAEVPLETLQLQPEEVMDARWADRREVESMLREGTLVDYQPGFLQLLLDGDGSMGALRSWRGRWPEGEKRP